MPVPDNKLLKTALDELRSRLPTGWRVGATNSSTEEDFALTFTSPDGRTAMLQAEVKRRVDPRTAKALPGPAEGALVVTRYLSARVRELLEEAGYSYIDATGNVRVVVSDPGLFMVAPGATTNPWPEARTPSLRGCTAGRIVNVLVMKPPPLGVRELAVLVDANPGYVSRVLGMLDSEALIDRTGRGKVDSVDWRALLRRWAEDAPRQRRTAPTTWLAPRGLHKATTRLEKSKLTHAITGSMAASKWGPSIAPSRLLTLYVSDSGTAASSLDLRPADSGANVLLLEPEDSTVFDLTTDKGGQRIAPLPFVVADLLSGPGREPNEAEALMDWMEKTPEEWRAR